MLRVTRYPVPPITDEREAIRQAISPWTPLPQRLRAIAALTWKPKGEGCVEDDFQQALLEAAKFLDNVVS